MWDGNENGNGNVRLCNMIGQLEGSGRLLIIVYTEGGTARCGG